MGHQCLICGRLEVVLEEYEGAFAHSPAQFRSACPLRRTYTRRGEAYAGISSNSGPNGGGSPAWGLVQHFAEGHDVKCAERGGLGNTAAAVVQAITAAAVEAKCWGAKATQRVGANAAFGIAKENRT